MSDRIRELVAIVAYSLDDERTVWRFEITATEQQFRRVVAYLKEQGISGMAKR